MRKFALFGLYFALPLGAADSGRAVAILQQRCLSCHGEQTAMSGLRLSSRAAALKGGARGPAVTPGDLGASRLWLAVTQAAAPSMPPGVKLPDEDIAILRDWMNAGPPWPDSASSVASAWWAFRK